VDIKLRDAQPVYGFKAPHVVASGRSMSATGGHGDSPDHTEDESYVVDSPDEMRHAVRLGFKHGADVIKLMATGGVMSVADSPLDAEFTLEEMAVATREAHARRGKVAAHAQGTEGIGLALKAGVDSIEHGIFLDEAEAEYMKAHNVYLVPTLNAVQGIVDYGQGQTPDYMVKKASDFAQAFFKNMKMAVKAGVPFATGTDAGTPFNDFETGYFDELNLLVNKVGMPVQQVLYAATKNAADLLGVADEYGSLQTGKYADFLVLKGNLLEDVNKFRQADKQVYLHGQRMF
jgi:imidazolonepropionase-like amidohydrolase